MGAQQLGLVAIGRLQEKRVVHLARRMADGEVERGEVVMVGLDVRPFGDREAHVAEDGGDLVDDLADRMDAATLGRRLAHRQRDIDRLGDEAGSDGGVLQLGLAGRQRLGDAVLQPVDRRALDLALLGGHCAQRLQQVRDGALLAESGDAYGLDGLLVGGSCDIGKQRALQDFEISSVGVHDKTLSIGTTRQRSA